MRVDLYGSFLGMRVDHIASCPEVDPVLCAAQDIPDHWDHQSIDWFRTDPSATIGLGKGWQIALGLPVDLRVLRIDYTTLDGAPYQPPYGGNHHRDETLFGFTDGRISAWRYASPAQGLVMGWGLGTTLPLGKTEDDPFSLAAQGLPHEHFQLGSGTFDPLLSGVLVLSGPRFGAWGSVDARLPLYQNGRAYRGSRTVSASLGPTMRVVQPLQLVATVDILLESPETWSGEPSGGRQTLTGSLLALWTVSPALVLQGGGRATAWQHAPGGGDDEPLWQGLVLTAGVSWTPPVLTGG
ncbi:MAG: hypothetical protein GXP62_14605 [Oligoflexia bacterium]|nr:hypothetical protein [Oligoflexia bacterium]